MKLQLRLLVMALVFAMTIVACVPAAVPVAEEAGADAAAADTTTGEKIQVRFWYGLGGELGEVIEEMIKQYNASQDEIEVVGHYKHLGTICSPKGD